MTIQQLTYLLEVHRTQSFSVAAKNLFITQSAISNSIISLEKEIGTPIFVRNKNGLSPTPRGKEIIEHAKRACESINAISIGKHPDKKTLRIGANSYSPAGNAFIRIMNECKDQDIEFSYEDTRRGDYLDRLLRGELDLVIFVNIASYTPGRLESVKKHNLDYEILDTVPAVVGVGPKHPLYNVETLDFRELSKYKLVQSTSAGVAGVKSIGAYLPIRKENTLIVCSSTLQQRVLEEGHAFTVKRQPARAHPEDTLRYFPVEGLNYTIYYVTNPRAPHCEELDRYIAYLKEEVAAGKA
ncbi:MAG: LysR family transcriptional regulator [Oscillospiraceae bacterium]|nr:LysR family transcriptional regulator [Oscillospiraceae bacterium]